MTSIHIQPRVASRGLRGAVIAENGDCRRFFPGFFLWQSLILLGLACFALPAAADPPPPDPCTPPDWGWPNGQHNGWWQTPDDPHVPPPAQWDDANSGSSWSFSFTNQNYTASIDSNGLLKYTYNGDLSDWWAKLVVQINNSPDPDKHKNLWIHWSGGSGSLSTHWWEVQNGAGVWTRLQFPDVQDLGAHTDAQGYYQNYSFRTQPAAERLVFNLDIGNYRALTFGKFYYSTMCVPEPESSAMMMAGLGLLAVIAPRRKERQTMKPVSA